MYLLDNKPVIIDSNPFVYKDGITVTVRRLYLIDPVTGGNKWFKLKHNIRQLKEDGFSKLLTFGGAWSNHIAAVARAGKLEGIQTTGVIRGEPESGNNVTLKRAINDGMRLIYISRTDYRKKQDPSFLKHLLPDLNDYFILPEGGSNRNGIEGCREITTDDDDTFQHIAVACGTGATAAGLIMNLKKHQHLTGISVLRDNNFLETAIQGFLDQFDVQQMQNSWHIEHEFHFGGYGKTTTGLDEFTRLFSERTGIIIEPVYTGKMFFGLEQLISSGKFAAGSNILAIHTGGLQYRLPY